MRKIHALNADTGRAYCGARNGLSPVEFLSSPIRSLCEACIPRGIQAIGMRAEARKRAEAAVWS